MTLRKKQIGSKEVNMGISNMQTNVVDEDITEDIPCITRTERIKNTPWNKIDGRRMMAVVLVVVIFLVSSAFYFHWFNMGLSKQEIQQRQVASVVSSIGSLMIIPKGTPVLATIKDISKLRKQQAFFINAKNGDDLVIFPQSGRAIIYSPSRNLIVNVGPVKYPKTPTAIKKVSSGFGSSKESQKTNSAIAVVNNTKITIDLRNGSGRNGLAASVAKDLKEKSLYLIAKIGDAGNGDYKKNFVVNIAKKSSESSSINSLAKSLSATVISALPYGEKPSSADIVVILGAS